MGFMRGLKSTVKAGMRALPGRRQSDLGGYVSVRPARGILSWDSRREPLRHLSENLRA
jgi:hypothetical protein